MKPYAAECTASPASPAGMRSDPNRTGWLEPVPESAAYVDRQAMQRGEGFDLPEDRDWCGYLVELAPTMPDEE